MFDPLKRLDREHEESVSSSCVRFRIGKKMKGRFFPSDSPTQQLHSSEKIWAKQAGAGGLL